VAADLDGARVVMLDTVYRDFGTGTCRAGTPTSSIRRRSMSRRRGTRRWSRSTSGTGRWPPPPHWTRGPAHPPNPHWLAERYPSGETAQLRRVYVRPEHRRRGLARQMVGQLPDFAKADGGYRAIHLHTYPHAPGAMGLWQTLGKVVRDEREEVPGGGAASCTSRSQRFKRQSFSCMVWPMFAPEGRERGP
jgi:GNAT superfamily N-acetyltransferase